MNGQRLQKFLSDSAELVSVVGHGSLMSIESAARSFKRIEAFRTCTVPGFARVFNKVCIHSIRSGAVDQGAREIACCSATPLPGHVLHAAAFDLHREEVPSLLEREHEFEVVPVEISEAGPHTTNTKTALLCVETTDEVYRTTKCSSESEYHRRVGQFYEGKIWRDDIRPARAYLQLCLTAARDLGQGVYENLLDASFLADRKTTVREYLNSQPDVLSWVTSPARYSASRGGHDGQEG